MHLAEKIYIRTLLICILCSLTVSSFGQETEDIVEYKYNPKSKLGLRLGLGVNSLNGNNFTKTKNAVSYTAGFYHHGRISGRHYFYYEVGGSFRGSKFRFNTDSNSISQVSIFYTELPIAYMYRLGADEKKPFFLMFGGGGGLNLRSSMLLGPNPIPRHFDLPLKRGNLFLMTGAHKYFGSVGLQFAVKAGLTNLNQNNWTGFEDVSPSPNQGRPIQTFALDFSLIF